MAIEFGRLQELQPLLALFPLRAKLRRAPDSASGPGPLMCGAGELRE